ncbi:hypothetical protein [Streptomyces sp. NBC_01013]|uniref:hypothetical protein n=1 Tax=Streptomyces sp. NBC_01013 TaxID=2903718 RepID=UPI00386734EB|nr:hypothetical protein OG538_24865 [Streptomyces sp. NBC_01013]
MSAEESRAHQRLDAALDRLALTFAGMTARPDEYNCVCHWGDAEELARLKVADTELDPDLLRRTWQACDWSDHPSVLRRVLPQFARSLVAGSADPWYAEAGRSFARGRWRQWPAEQAGAVREFLHAWWARTLVDPRPVVPVPDVLALATEASGDVVPWLSVWETLTGATADGHLAALVERWEWELIGDQLPWSAWDNEEEIRTGLCSWLVRNAPARLRAHGAPAELLNRIRLLGLDGAARWEDPGWDGRPC